MIPAPAGGPDYDARIRRAQQLASKHAFATEVLTLYAQIAGFQKSLYATISRNFGRQWVAQSHGEQRWELNLPLLLPHFPEFLALLQRAGPPPVVNAAKQIGLRGSSEQARLLSDFWSLVGCMDKEGGGAKSDEPLTKFVLRGFLQPYAEFVSAQGKSQALAETCRKCPRCGSAPLLGVLRPEGDGSKRALVCSFCLQEWEFRRILCAACGEETEGRLPVYVAEQFPHIRVEVCDTCKFYVRTIDLTKDGHAVPIVDDVGALPLSLWAQEHGYTRLQGNLLGT